jgi:hypothetical protein
MVQVLQSINQPQLKRLISAIEQTFQIRLRKRFMNTYTDVSKFQIVKVQVKC